MRRYLQLYRHFLIFSLKKAMEFRVDFFFRIAMDIIFYIVNILFFKVLYLHTASFGGLTESQAFIFVGSYLLLDAVNMTFVSNNLWWLPILVNRGDIDYYLVRPASPLFFLCFRDIAVSSFINLVMTIGILVWGFVTYPDSIPLIHIIGYLLALLIGFILYFIIRLLFILPVFWVQSGRGLDEVAFNLQKALEKPHQIFTGWVRRILTTLLPFAVIVSYPVSILFQGFNIAVIFEMLFLCLIFFLITKHFWRKALRIYHSASS